MPPKCHYFPSSARPIFKEGQLVFMTTVHALDLP